ncbi:MAG: (R)-mandelonitrile lyase [Fimbriimonadales bacterium]
MKQLLLTALTLSMLGSAMSPGEDQTQGGLKTLTIARSGSQPSQKGPPEYFTGSVRIDPLFNPEATSDVMCAHVTFEPGARTAWHTHPRGQTLIVTSGAGRVQTWGNKFEEIRPGDVVRIPAGAKHWHGGGLTTGMSHFAIMEQLGDKVVDWMEKVTDAQHEGRPGGE